MPTALQCVLPIQLPSPQAVGQVSLKVGAGQGQQQFLDGSDVAVIQVNLDLSNDLLDNAVQVTYALGSGFSHGESFVKYNSVLQCPR